MANVNVASMSFPYPLGVLRPGANYASASIPLTTNVQPVKVQPVQQPVAALPMGTGLMAENKFNLLEIRAWAGDGTIAANSGAIYLCSNASAPDTTAFTNVIDVIQPGEAWPRSKEWADTIDISTIFIGATNATDFAIANISQF